MRLATVLFLCVVGLLGPCTLTAQVQDASASRPLSAISVASLKVPAKAWKHYAKAQAAARAKHEDQCAEEIDKALSIAPRFAEAYLWRAARGVAEKRFQAAIDDALLARQIEPSIAWSQTLLAGAYNGLERYHDADVLMENLQGDEANSWQAKYEMARAQVGLGNVEGALHWSELALAKAPPSFSDAHLLRANALQLAHRWQDAMVQMEAYLATDAPENRRTVVLAALKQTRLTAEAEALPGPRLK